LIVSLITSLFLGGVTMTEAQAEDASTTSPEIQELQQKKQKAELERDIAKAKEDAAKSNAAAAKAGLPTPETKALEGTISVDEKAALPSQILTYKTMWEIAKQAASDITTIKSNTDTLVVFSEKELGGVAAYKSALDQIGAFQTRYNELNPPLVGAAAVPAFALLAPELVATLTKSVADVVALFRTNVEIKGTTVTVDDVAVVAELARGLREKKPTAKVIYPPLYYPLQFFKDGVKKSKLIEKLGALYNDRIRAVEAIVAIEAKPPEQQKSEKDKIPSLKSLNEQVDKFTNALAVVDDKTGLSALTILLKAEQLQLSLAQENTAIVYIKTDAVGGSNKTTRNLFTGTKLLHTGGLVVTFMLFDNDGAILYSKTYSCATEFTEFENEPEPKLLKNF
jgi:hypothetical protein